MHRSDASYSASEAAAAVGLSRQGLLTWERRYGFPTPARTSQGHRRYTTDELLTIAVARAAVDRGESLPDAIRQARATPASSSTSKSGIDRLVRASLDRLPLNLAILRAPEFRYVYVNLPLARLVPEIKLGARVGDVLGVRGISALERVVRTGEPWQTSEEGVVIDGELRFFQATYLRLPTLPHQPHHVLAIGWETTETVRAKRRLGRVATQAGSVAAARAATMLRALDAVAEAAGRGDTHLLTTGVGRVADALGADGVTFAEHVDGQLVPCASVTSTRALRWHAFPTAGIPALEAALAGDSLVWLQASEASRNERALLRRLVARTLCVAPVRTPSRPEGALVLRWSLAEFKAATDVVRFLHVVCRLVSLGRGLT
jgi:DNA-binding transcriptional MerR regulator